MIQVTKEEFFDYWNLKEGDPDAETLWQEKLLMLQGKHLRSAPMIFVSQDIHYESPIDGRVIRTKHEREEDLKRSGCIEYDPGMKQDANRRLMEHEKALDASIDRQVEAEYERMPSRKREVLANEIAAGVTAEPVRLTANGG